MKIFYIIIVIISCEEKIITMFGILILIGIGMPVLVKVKGYTRVRNSKEERVRPHYRRVWVAR